MHLATTSQLTNATSRKLQPVRGIRAFLGAQCSEIMQGVRSGSKQQVVNGSTIAARHEARKRFEVFCSMEEQLAYR